MTRPLTSIVILTRNQLDYTRLCVEGIARCTTEPYELVFVDNGSTDGTLDYLRSIDGATVIDNEHNHGFGGGCNQGIAASVGERVLLLNNDVVPTAGWLGALHDALDSSQEVGLAGPRSNRITGVQQVADAAYDQETLDGLDTWAQGWCDAHAGRRDQTARLVGFCILMERAVIERIGGFDLRYEIGNFEDDDLCLRAGVAGFRCVIAHDSFIHHFGSRTFAGEQIDYRTSMATNYRRFLDAWGLDVQDIDPVTFAYPVGRILTSTTWDGDRHYAPLVGVADQGARVDVSEAHSHVVAVACDRWDPQATRAALDAAMLTWGCDDDVTIVVRIDPRDTSSEGLLEAAADAHEATGLPDITVVVADEADDRPLLRIADEVIVAGRSAWARRQLAQQLGVAVRDA